MALAALHIAVGTVVSLMHLCNGLPYFVPIPIFLALSEFLYIVTYYSVKALFSLTVLAIKAVAQEGHSPKQGTLVS